MLKQSQLLQYCMLLLLVSLAISKPADAADHRLRLTAHVAIWGGSCEPGSSNILAGSIFFLEVTNSIDQPAQPLSPGWPEGYILEAALDLPSKHPFTPSPGLLERLEPERILSPINRASDQILRQHPADFHDLQDLNSKCFALMIPPDLAGHALSFRARYEGEGHNLISKTLGPFRILAPCDMSDTARVVASRIYKSWEIGDFPSGVELADSMLAVGLSDAAGWKWAGTMARGLERYEQALLYLERLYEDFGVVSVELNTANPPRFNPERPFDPHAHEAYERLCNWLLRLQAERDQEQMDQK